MGLRPAQERILNYDGGRVAVNAVPGSGKTYTLSILAVELLANGKIDIGLGQQILIVTYLNSSVDAFRAGIRQQLHALNKDELGFDVRTIHSLSLEIVRQAESELSSSPIELIVAAETLTEGILFQAIDGWSAANPELLSPFVPSQSPQNRVRWREMTVKLARDFIRMAKNRRYTPQEIQSDVANNGSGKHGGNGLVIPQDGSDISLLLMLTDIYQRYQTILARQNAIDFDDIIWQAIELLETRDDLVNALRERWPYVLEDEAQDSIPLQEKMLDVLTGYHGNWVRVGDPNQAITSTFTSADPRHFTSFIRRPDVTSLPLPNSGRSAARIYSLANSLVHWVINHHPVQEVRQSAFLLQNIQPTPAGDSQPNPTDSETMVTFKVYGHREEQELPGVALLGTRLTKENPEYSVAILTTTNALGKSLAGHLNHLGASFDDMLRGSGKVREVASVLMALVRLLANPLNRAALEASYSALYDINHPSATGYQNIRKMSALLRSVSKPELFLFPTAVQKLSNALPRNIVTGEETRFLHSFSAFLQRLFEIRPLPIDDLLLSLGDLLFAAGDEDSNTSYELELAITYQIANEMRLRFDSQPSWRIPELAAELADLATGRSQLKSFGSKESGYKPAPGRITLATQHGAKGMEWDAVFLVGLDEFWIPGDLDAKFQGVFENTGDDPAAETTALLLEIMEDDLGHYPGRTATESAHIEIINERLRLLYVGITRARKRLHISRSQYIHRFNTDVAAKPASVMAALYQFASEYQPTG